LKKPLVPIGTKKDLEDRSLKRGRTKAITYLVINEGGEGEEIEEVGEESPDVGVSIFAKAFIVEPINLRDLPGLVVSAKDCYAVSVAQFESNKQRHCFDRVIAAIDVVAHEEIVGVWRVSSNAEELGEIVLASEADR
jgi:hypothetical protein